MAGIQPGLSKVSSCKFFSCFSVPGIENDVAFQSPTQKDRKLRQEKN